MSEHDSRVVEANKAADAAMQKADHAEALLTLEKQKLLEAECKVNCSHGEATTTLKHVLCS